MVALTFDDGPYAKVGNRIMDCAAQYNAKVTFYVVGDRVNTYASEMRRMVNEGHEVGNHTMNHPDMAAIADREAFTKELTELEELYESVTGEKMKIPPLYTRGGETVFEVRSQPGRYDLYRIER